MKRSLLLSLAFTAIMILVLRIQGQSLITPASPNGILDLEFAGNASRLAQLRLFWNGTTLFYNILLDFLLIVAYVWLLMTGCRLAGHKGRWEKAGEVFRTLSLAAGLFDVCENFLMLLIWQEKFSAGLLKMVFICALVKFALVAIILLFLLASVLRALSRPMLKS
jgi:hypothetical protein